MRHIDWVTRARDAIIERDETPFEWGLFDCCRGACAVWKAQTGIDPGRKLWRYDDRRSAMRVLREEAPKGTRAKDRLMVVATRLAAEAGMVEHEPSRAQRGFIVFAMAPVSLDPVVVEPALGVVDLNGLNILFPKHEGGWIVHPMSIAIRSWGVA